MIAYLKGTPSIIDREFILIVNNVGYGVSVSNATLSQSVGKSEVSLYIYTHVKEEALELFGFPTQEEKKLFTLLLAISGVGPKTALAITEKGANGIITAVQEADISFFKNVPRVGKKLAQKIIIDLTPKLGSIKELQLAPLVGIQADVSAALQALGFNEQDVEDLIRLEKFENMTIEQALPLCLKKLGS